ncbi:hypothetical protein SFRURICE_011041 [Spodoptera frugiperda]|nr:hypothetical protein SFRURICE_011041 [Spodoptera frugiperda]
MNSSAPVSGRIMQWLVMWCQVLLLAEGMHLMPQYYETSTDESVYRVIDKLNDILSLHRTLKSMPTINPELDVTRLQTHSYSSLPPTPTRSVSRPPYPHIDLSAPQPRGSSIPIILLGGASQRQVVKSQPITFMKPTISLVGTTVSPLVKHPYPFVNPQRKPVKICMTSIPAMFTTTRRPPTFWDKLIDYFIPARTIGR